MVALIGIVCANRPFMLNTLLLSGYIPPSSDAIRFLLGVFALSVLAGLLVLWGGVRLIKRDKWIGFAVVLVAVALPAAGFRAFCSNYNEKPRNYWAYTPASGWFADARSGK
jgi:hypothetical protein